MYEIHNHLKKADIFTILNISLGFLAMVFILNNRLSVAARLIIAAVVADGFDGYFARKSKTESEFGMNFDSLSDCVSFGVTPALLIYSFVGYWWVVAVSIIYVIAGVLRLARYNVTFKDLEKGTFIGMPIPIGALLLILAVVGNLPDIAVIIVVLVSAYLMVSSITFKKIGSSAFPIQNFIILALAVVPIAYLVPVARIAFAGCVGGIVMRKK